MAVATAGIYCFYKVFRRETLVSRYHAINFYKRLGFYIARIMTIYSREHRDPPIQHSLADTMGRPVSVLSYKCIVCCYI